MQASAPIEFVWQLAAREAIAADHLRIEPEHFLAAALKFAELPIDRGEPGAGAPHALEVEAVRRRLAERAIESTKVRREVRARLGKGGRPYKGGVLHRSDAARSLFDLAARIAVETGSTALSVEHLLEAMLRAPTPVIGAVLGAVPPPVTELARGVVDLTALARAGELVPAPGREAEATVLLEALSRPGGALVLLVADEEAEARAVVEAAAARLAREGAARPAGPRRLLDASRLDPEAPDRWLALESLFAAAATDGGLAVCLPALAELDGVRAAWAKRLRRVRDEGAGRFVCRVGAGTHALAVARDRGWKHAAQVLWIGKPSPTEVPWEL